MVKSSVELGLSGGCTILPGNLGDTMIGTHGRHILPVEEAAMTLAALEAPRLARIPAHMRAQLQPMIETDRSAAAIVLQLASKFGGWHSMKFYAEARTGRADHRGPWAFGSSTSPTRTRQTPTMSVLDEIHMAWTRSLRASLGLTG